MLVLVRFKTFPFEERAISGVTFGVARLSILLESETTVLYTLPSLPPQMTSILPSHMISMLHVHFELTVLWEENFMEENLTQFPLS